MGSSQFPSKTELVQALGGREQRHEKPPTDPSRDKKQLSAAPSAHTSRHHPRISSRASPGCDPVSTRYSRPFTKPHRVSQNGATRSAEGGFESGGVCPGSIFTANPRARPCCVLARRTAAHVVPTCGRGTRGRNRRARGVVAVCRELRVPVVSSVRRRRDAYRAHLCRTCVRETSCHVEQLLSATPRTRTDAHGTITCRLGASMHTRQSASTPHRRRWSSRDRACECRGSTVVRRERVRGTFYRCSFISTETTHATTPCARR